MAYGRRELEKIIMMTKWPVNLDPLKNREQKLIPVLRSLKHRVRFATSYDVSALKINPPFLVSGQGC